MSNYENIPLELRQVKQWIVWRLEGKTDTFKGTKVPYSARNPYQKASTTDPATWGFFGEVASLCSLHDMTGIGYVFVAEQGIVAIDIDGCIQADGSVSSPAKEALDLFLGRTYIETSHSGKGYHILVKGNMPSNRLKGIEVYNYGRYFVMTGHLAGDCMEIATMPEELAKLYALYSDPVKEWKNPDWNQNKPTGQNLSLVDSLNLRVQDIGSPGNAKDSGNGEVRGAHPFHGSVTGNNYAINTQKNVWMCRRDGHNSGGGPLELFAVRSGIIQCEDARAGCLEGKWREVFDALKRAGYKVPEKKRALESIEKVGFPRQTKEEDFNDPFLNSCTDIGNAHRLVKKYGQDIRYCPDQSDWYTWSGSVWERDALDKVTSYAKDVVRDIYAESANNLDLAKWWIKSANQNRLSGMVAVSRSDLAVKPDYWNHNPDLFNVKNGTLELRDVSFREHRREDFINKIGGVNYQPDEKCPLWLKHLETIFNDDQKFISDFQLLCGYTLLANNPEQIFFVLYGSGKNGKSTTLEVLRTVLGDYAINVDPSTIMVRKSNEGARSDLARLDGARLITSIEGDVGGRLAEGLIKQLTGNDPLTCRALYEKERELRIGAKIWHATNHKPTIRGTDPAIWRRVWLIPFEVQIPESMRDREILGKLIDEGVGILNWMLVGLERYQEAGRLDQPEKIRTAVEEYLKEQDLLGDFLCDYALIQDGEISRAGLFDDYRQWCDRERIEHPMSQKSLATKLKERGVVDGQIRHGQRYWKGIRAKTQTELSIGQVMVNV